MNHAHAPRSRSGRGWRDARHLVIEGEARVVSRRPAGAPRAGGSTQDSMPASRWGAALEAAAILAPGRLVRLALPAGLAAVAIVVLMLAPGEGERHGAAQPTMRMASVPVTP